MTILVCDRVLLASNEIIIRSLDVGLYYVYNQAHIIELYVIDHVSDVVGIFQRYHIHLRLGSVPYNTMKDKSFRPLY